MYYLPSDIGTVRLSCFGRKVLLYLCSSYCYFSLEKCQNNVAWVTLRKKSIFCHRPKEICLRAEYLSARQIVASRVSVQCDNIYLPLKDKGNTGRGALYYKCYIQTVKLLQYLVRKRISSDFRHTANKSCRTARGSNGAWCGDAAGDGQSRSSAESPAVGEDSDYFTPEDTTTTILTVPKPPRNPVSLHRHHPCDVIALHHRLRCVCLFAQFSLGT